VGVEGWKQVQASMHLGVHASDVSRIMHRRRWRR
jgi:hypothetical protein